MDVTLPDGTIVEGVPDEMSKAEFTNFAVKNGYAKSLSSPADIAMADPTSGMSSFDKFRAGYGKKVSDMGLGIQQLLSSQAPSLTGLITGQSSPLQQRIDESRKLDQPLMSTPAGFAGNITGGMASMAPALAIPGVNTLAGAAVLGGTQGAMEPVPSGGSRTLNTAVGAGGGLGGQFLGSKLAQLAQNKIQTLATQQGQNAVRDATLQSGQEAGYVLPPSAVNQSWIGNRLEGVAGKAALGQEASARNQVTTNELARKALGIPENQAISQGGLEAIRATEGQAYAKVAALSKDAAEALVNLKQARSDASANFKFYDRSANPEALQKAQRAAADAKFWETFLESEAQNAGKPELVQTLRAARERIAKTYDVERALNTSTGDVSAPALARAIDRGKYLTGDLETAGRFADAFPKYSAEGAKNPAAGVSKSEALASGLFGALGYGASGNVYGALMGALPMLSGPVRAGILSGPGQNLIAPSYQAGILAQLLQRPEGAQILKLLAPGLLGAQ